MLTFPCGLGSSSYFRNWKYGAYDLNNLGISLEVALDCPDTEATTLSLTLVDLLADVEAMGMGWLVVEVDDDELGDTATYVGSSSSISMVSCSDIDTLTQ